MLGLDRHAARVTWTVFLIVLVILVAYMARHTIIVFLVALFFAYLLSPAVESLDRMIPPRISRNWSLVIVYLTFISALIGIGFVVGSTIVEQASSLAVRLPELIKSKDPLQGFPFPGWLDPLRLRIVDDYPFSARQFGQIRDPDSEDGCGGGVQARRNSP